MERLATVRIPQRCLVVLVGPSGSGKTTWAEQHFRADAVVSADRLRAMVGEGESDQAASADAFAALDPIVEARLARGLLTVVDTLGLDDDRRAGYLERPGQGVSRPQPGPAGPRARPGGRGPAPAVVRGARPPRRRGLRRCLRAGRGPGRRGSVPRSRRRDCAPAGRSAGLAFGLHLSSFTWGVPRRRDRPAPARHAGQATGDLPPDPDDGVQPVVPRRRGRQVEVLWCYLNMVEDWRAELSDEVRAKVDSIKHFPHYNTFSLQLDPVEVNLMSSLTAWSVGNDAYAEAFVELFERP